MKKGDYLRRVGSGIRLTPALGTVHMLTESPPFQGKQSKVVKSSEFVSGKLPFPHYVLISNKLFINKTKVTAQN